MTYTAFPSFLLPDPCPTCKGSGVVTHAMWVLGTQNGTRGVKKLEVEVGCRDCASYPKGTRRGQ